MTSTRRNWKRVARISALTAAAVITSSSAAWAQPDSKACAEAKKAVADDQAKIADLESHKGDPQYAGSAETVYKAKHDALERQLSIDYGLQKKACAASVGPNTKTGSLRPRYMVLTVVYAPPGTAGARGASDASILDYASGSSYGTTVATTDAWKNNLSITATVSALGNSASLGFAWDVGSSSTTTVSFTKSTKDDRQVFAPGEDGIDHDNDVVYLWLNPEIDVTVTGKALTWTPTTWGIPAMDIQFLEVKALKKPQLLTDPSVAKSVNVSPDLAARLAKYGFTAADFAQILGADPFANGSTNVDTTRFVQTPYTYPYEYSDAPMRNNSQIGNVSAMGTSTTSHDSYTISASVTVGFNIGVVSASLKLSDSFNWSHQSTNSSNTTATQTASFGIATPSAAWAGPTDVSVYWDNLFGTFMFGWTPLPGTSSSAPYDRKRAAAAVFLSGHVADNAGKPLPGQEVWVRTTGLQLRTLTNAQGAYRFLGVPLGSAAAQADVQVGDTHQAVTVGPALAVADFGAVGGSPGATSAPSSAQAPSSLPPAAAPPASEAGCAGCASGERADSRAAGGLALVALGALLRRRKKS